MARMMIRMFVLMCAAAAMVGCGGQTRTYDVSVENRTDRTVTLWLTKDGPPEEEGWRSPEQLNEHRKDDDVKYDMATISPGRTAYTGEMKGKFNSGTNAVLRVYEGSPDLSELMGGKDKSRERVGHILAPGKSKLAVVDRDGSLKILKE